MDEKNVKQVENNTSQVNVLTPKKQVKKPTIKYQIMRFLMINVGVFIMALGIYLFLIPSNLAAGGVSGLSIVISHYIPSLNIGFIILAINMILFVLAFIFIGKEFLGYTVYSSFLLSILIAGFEIVIPIKEPLVNDLMLNIIYGMFTSSVGIAIVFYYNASTGGTDIIAKIINKYSGMPIGKALFLADAFVTLCAAVTFGIASGMYAFLGILINGFMIDKVISGFEERVKVEIISSNPEKITEFIKNDLDRGFTFVLGRGGYTSDEKRIINVILRRREYLRLLHFINSSDQGAFVIISNVHDVYGLGFKSLR